METEGKYEPRRDAFRRPDDEILLNVIKELRANPDQYRRLRDEMRRADSDEDRVNTLLQFATNDRELAALLPATAGAAPAAAWTTVTVTTVFVLEDSAY